MDYAYNDTWGDDGFDCVMRYLRAPYDPTNPNFFDQQAENLQELYDDLHDRMEALDQEYLRIRTAVDPNAGDLELDESMEEEAERTSELDEDEEEIRAEDEEGEETQAQERQRRPKKPRRPYTISCAIRQTNFFESSLQWENEHFRTMYRLVFQIRPQEHHVLTLETSACRKTPSGVLRVFCNPIPYSNLSAANHNAQCISSLLCFSCATVSRVRMSAIRCYSPQLVRELSRYTADVSFARSVSMACRISSGQRAIGKRR